MAGVSIPGVPADLAAMLRALDQRVSNLENSSRLYNSAIREGTLRIQDSAGNPMVTIGKLDDGTYGIKIQDAVGHELIRLGMLPDGSYGIWVKNVNGRSLLKIDTLHGQTAPRAVVPMNTGNFAYLSGSSTTTFRPGGLGTSWSEIWRGDFWSVGNTVSYDMTMYANGGSISWRIWCYEFSGTPALVVGPNTETTNVPRAGNFTIPPGCLVGGSGDPAGRNMTVRVEVMVNSGFVTADVVMNAAMISYNV